MKSTCLVLILLLFHSLDFADCAQTILRTEVVGHIVSVSGNGNTIAVINLASPSNGKPCLTLFKKIAAAYQRIEVKNIEIWVPQIGRNYNKPRLTDDGYYLYFINLLTGLVTKASLVNTSITNPYVKLIDLNNHACQNITFQCKFSVSGDYVAYYSHNARMLTITQKDQKVVLNQSILNNLYPYIPNYDHYYVCNYFNGSYSMPYGYFYYCLYQQCLQTSCNYQFDGTNMMMPSSPAEIQSITLSSHGQLVIRIPGHFWKYYYILNFNDGSFYEKTVRRDLAPEVFTYMSDYAFWSKNGTYDNNKDGYVWRTYKELVLSNRLGTKLRRMYNDLHQFEVSKDHITTQGYSLSWNGEHAIELIQAKSQMISDPDLKIVVEAPPTSFDMNSDGSLVAYLHDYAHLVVIQQKLGVPEVVNLCHTPYLYFANYEKCADQKSIFFFSFSTSILLLIFNITIFTILIILYCRRRNKKRQQQAQPEKQEPEQKQNELKGKQMIKQYQTRDPISLNSLNTLQDNTATKPKQEEIALSIN